MIQYPPHPVDVIHSKVHKLCETKKPKEELLV
jgi:hypothetical protein